MALVVTDSQNYEDIADAINTKLGTSDQYYPSEMADAILTISGGDTVARNPVTYSQQNTYITEYLAGELTPAEYKNDSSATRADIPDGIETTFAENGTLLLHDGNGGESASTITSGDVDVYNVCPNKSGYYINQSSGVVSQVGFLNPTGQVRMIYTTGTSSVKTANTRDIGGWAADNGTLKYGKIIRGCRLSLDGVPTASDYDKKTFVDLLRIRDEIDLRSYTEVVNITESAFGSEVEYNRFPIASGEEYAVSNAGTAAMYVSAIKHIISDLHYGRNVFVHCAAGADRTGVVCVILESLCGVSENDVRTDYGLTSFACKADGFSNYYDRTGTNTAYVNLISALKAYGGTGASLFEGVLAWGRTYGLTSDDVNTLRTNLISGSPNLYSFITNTLTHVTNSSNATYIAQGSSYSSTLTVDTAYEMYSIHIYMGGTDITSSAYNSSTGEISIADVTDDITISAEAIPESTTIYTIGNTLTNVTSSNNATDAIENTSYTATLFPITGYEISSVSVTMGGVDVTSTVYSSSTNVISIAAVTGNVVIVASATAIPTINILTVVGYQDGHRISLSDGSDTTSRATGYCLPGYIEISNGDVIRWTGASIIDDLGSSTTLETNLCFYRYENDSYTATAIPVHLRLSSETYQGPHTEANYYSVSKSGDVYTLTLNPAGDNSTATHVRFALYGSGTDIYMTLNQPLV